jgi:hypothetical protein
MLTSDELQSALMLTVEFLKCIILRKLYQLCHLNNKYLYKKQYVITNNNVQYGIVLI